MDQRLQFLSSYLKEEMSVTDLCHEYGISRPTAYKWVKRYDEVGPEGLLDLARTPHSCPSATSPEIENEILALRKRFPSWGARKLKAPNQLWCMDFKGYFLTGDGYRCDPFTITDAHSRFLIRCQAVARMDLAQVSAVCDAAMREFGVPERIRTDNGAPFAGVGLLGLSKLSLGWMKLGIVHERIQPGHPQQNGRHERMHRTLKEDTAKPPARTATAQQKKFDRFRYIFNHERPHEALANETPGSIYVPSARLLPSRVASFQYPRSFQTRRVNNSGDISWHKGRVFVSEVFRNEEIGLEQMDEDVHRVFFCSTELGEFNSAEMRFRPVLRA